MIQTHDVLQRKHQQQVTKHRCRSKFLNVFCEAANPTGNVLQRVALTLSNPIFLPPAYSPALIYFGRERGWWITCNYPTVLKDKNRNSTTCTICWLNSVLHEKKRREQENHDFPVSDAFPHVVRTLVNR
jgi:hypothetical protein